LGGYIICAFGGVGCSAESGIASAASFNFGCTNFGKSAVGGRTARANAFDVRMASMSGNSNLEKLVGSPDLVPNFED